MFKANTERNMWNCFANKGCKGGNILDLVMAIERIDKVRDAGVLIVDWFGLYKRSALNEATSVPETSEEITDELTVNSPLAFTLKSLERDHTAVHKLGLKPETIEHFGIGWCSKGMLKGRVAVPIYNPQNQLLAYAGMPNKMDKAYKFPPTGKFNRGLELYNAQNAFLTAQGDQFVLIIVQSFLEVWRACEHGLRAIALMHQSLTHQQLDLLLDHLADWQQIILVCEPANQIGDMLVALTSNFSVRYAPFNYADESVYQLVQNMQEKTS